MTKNSFAAEVTFKKLNGDNARSGTNVFEWYKRFKEGCKEVEDDSMSGSPSAIKTEVNVEWVKQIVQGNHWLTV